MNKDELSKIMKMQEETTVKNLKTSLDSEFLYIDKVDFPNLPEMEKASLLLVDSVKSYETCGNTILFQTNGVFLKKRFFYRFFDFRPTYDRLDRSRNICVGITLCSSGVVRIRAGEGFSLSERTTEMLAADFVRKADFKVSENDHTVLIQTDELDIHVSKSPWNLSISNKSGQILYQQMGEEDRSFMKFENCPFGFLYDPLNNQRYSCESVRFTDTEHFYGFGEKFTALDKKGQNVNLWNTNALGTYTPRSYKNIPFFMSTAGYGIFFNTSFKTCCNMGQNHYKAYAMMSADEEIDYFFIHGPQLKTILGRYAGLTGKPALPPLWSFGFWISKISYESREEVERLAAHLRAERIPCDVIHLDTNWYEENWVCDYQFSPTRFPNAPEMIRQLGDQGFRITLWQMPYIDKGERSHQVYDEGFSKGYFAFRKDGAEDFRHGLIDFSNPDAVDWYKNKLLRPLLEMGVAAFKVDFGESAPDFYQYAGYNGEEMHNLYALLYNKAVFEVTQDVYGKNEAVIWARSAWAGSQRYPLHWGGDCGTDFMALTTSIKAGLSFGLSGFPFWSHDVGGFFFASYPELYIRWLQVGVFSSHIRTHGFYTREPWDFGEEALAISRRYLELRYQLLPYIFSQAKTCVEHCLPMMRALVLEFEDDPNVAALDNQYLFGDSLLVAPILTESGKRKVYLPEGIWFDYWTGQTMEASGWIDVIAPLDVIPVFVRENAIIPSGPIVQHTRELTWEEITLSLYPVGKGDHSFELYDGGKTVRIDMTVDAARIRLEIPDVYRQYHIQLPGQQEWLLFVNGHVLEAESDGSYFIKL